MIAQLVLSAVVVFAAVPAKKVPVRKSPARTMRASSAPVQSAYRKSPYVGAISFDCSTGKVISEFNADAAAYPASVTKLMTLLLVLEDVRAGKYSFDTDVVATPEAYYCEPSWVGIKVGEKMSVKSLCMALMVESANDAAIVLGVHSAGSFSGFVARMNARAAELGMSSTHYYNPNGLPPNSGKRYPWKSFNVSTARDQLKLAQKLVAMPETLSLTSIKTCDLVRCPDGYRVSVTRRTNEPLCTTTLAAGEKVVKQLRNHNNIMRTDKLKIVNPDGKEAIDGLKTGYIDAGGSSIVLTGSRSGKRVIVVVLGSSSSKERDDKALNLMKDALGAVAW